MGKAALSRGEILGRIMLVALIFPSLLVVIGCCGLVPKTPATLRFWLQVAMLSYPLCVLSIALEWRWPWLREAAYMGHAILLLLVCLVVRPDIHPRGWLVERMFAPITQFIYRADPASNPTYRQVDVSP